MAEKELLDFYFSSKQNEHIRKHKTWNGEVFFQNRFKDQPYSECIAHGKKPVGKWDDYRFVGTGTFSDCTFK